MLSLLYAFAYFILRCSTLAIKDYEIYDLEHNSEDFMTEASKWQVSVSNAQGKVYTNCNGKYILGGFEVTWSPTVRFKRTYSSLVSHSSAFITVDFWLLGSWDVFDTIQIKVMDGTKEAFNRTIHPIIPPAVWSGTTCADTTNVNSLMPATIITQVPHTSSDLSLEITCQSQFVPGQGLAYCGVRNVRILLSKNERTQSINAITQTGAAGLLTSLAWGCPSGNVKNTTSGACLACSNDCENCFNQTSCLSCKKERIYDGLNCVQCHASCKTCSGGLDNQCLSCHPGQFLHPNGTCRSDCPSPYLTKTRNNIQYCEFPCDSNSYLDPNSSCISLCPSPLVVQQEYGAHYCLSPCQSSDDFYYLTENICRATCASPYIVEYDQFYNGCYLPKQGKPIDYVKAVSGGIVSVSLLFNSLISFADPAAILVGTLATMNNYIKYLNISYSEDFVERLDFQFASSISMDFWFSGSEFSVEESAKNAIPYVFKKYGLEPSFLDNFWPAVLFLAIISGIITLIKASEWAFKKLKKKERLPFIHVYKAKTLLENLFLIFFYTAYPNVVFFSVIEFASPRVRSDMDGIGVCVSVFLMLYGLKVFWSHYSLIRREAKLIDQEVILTVDDLESFYKKNESSLILIKGYKDLPFACHLFPLVFTGRATICAIVMAALYEYPFVQTTILIVLNVVMLLYLLVQMPLKDKAQGIYQLLYELILLAMNATVMSIAASNKKGDLQVKEGLEQFLMSLYIIFNFLSLIYTVTRIIKSIAQALRERRQEGTAVAHNKVVPIDESHFTRNTSIDPTLFESFYVGKKTKGNKTFATLEHEDVNGNMFGSPEKKTNEEIQAFAAVDQSSFIHNDTSFNDLLRESTKPKSFNDKELGDNKSVVFQKEPSLPDYKQNSQNFAADIEASLFGNIQGEESPQKSMFLSRAMKMKNSQTKVAIRPVRVGNDIMSLQKIATLESRPGSGSSSEAAEVVWKRGEKKQ